MISQDKPLSPESSGAYQTNEVDLVQLWLILLKRKYLLGGVFFICLLVGAAFVFLAPTKYTYSTTIQIGKTFTSNGEGVIREIESSEVVLAKLKESYIPLAVNQMMMLEDKVFAVKVKNPKGSDLMILSSKCMTNMAKSYTKLHNLVTKPLMEDHLKIIGVPRKEYQILSQQESIKLKNLEDPRIYSIEEKNLQIQVEAAKMYLTEIENTEKLLLSQKIRLTETQVLLEQQITKAEDELAQVHASQPKAANEVDEGVHAMNLLMITNQTMEKEKRLYRLQERTIDLEDKKEILRNDITQNSQERKLQKEEIAKLQLELIQLKVQREADIDYQKMVISSIDNKLANLQETRPLGVAVRSVRPSNPSKTVVLAISGLLGLVGGVFLAFCAELVSVARRQMTVLSR